MKLKTLCIGSLLSMVLLGASWVSAGTLWLSNGDKVSGTLLSVGDGKVKWKSPILGGLSVNLDQIQQMDTEGGFSLDVDNEVMEGCTLYGKDQRQWMRCEGVADRALPSWKLMRRIKRGRFSDAEEYQLAGSATVAVEDSSGNSDERDIGVDVLAEIRNNKNRHTFRVDIDTSEADGEQTEEEHTYSYKYDRFVSKKWFWSGDGRYERDDFKELEVRKTVGLGLGYQVYDSASVKLSFEGGVNYIVEEFSDGRDNEKGAFHLNTNYAWKISDIGLSLFHRNQYLQTFESSEDWEVETETGLVLPVLGRLSSELKYELDYDNAPANEDDSTDKVWTFGLRYDW
jgi:putative salt-induced outer membrane protein YdiY